MSEQSIINQSGIIPTGGHILVLPDPVEEITAGGIILTKSTQADERQLTTIGTLIDVGQGAWADLDDGSPWAKVGDKVLYARHSGFSISGEDDEDYILMNDVDVLARLLF